MAMQGDPTELKEQACMVAAVAEKEKAIVKLAASIKQAQAVAAAVIKASHTQLLQHGPGIALL